MQDELYAALAKVRDNLYGAGTALDELLQLKNKQVQGSYDITKIHWRPEQGTKGPYERADEQENRESKDYASLSADLREHDGKVTQDRFFYWLFQDGKAIGRKQVNRKA